MSSVIHYRFKAGSSEWARIAFEGHATTLGELKRAIADQKKLNPTQQSAMSGAGGGGAEGAASGGGCHGGRMLQDFELILTNSDTGEEYHGEMTSIPKNSSVIVKRVPAQRAKIIRIEADQPDMPFSPLSGARVASDAFDLAGGKKRQKAVGGSGSAIQATDAVEELHRRSAMAALTAGRFGAAGDEFGDDPLDEERWNQRDEERKAAEAKERAAQIALQQAKTLAAQQLEAEQMRQQQAALIAAAPPPVPLAGTGAYVRPPPSRPPPPGYICHNCKQPGHWKQSCPTASHLSAPSVSKILAQQQQIAALIYAPRTTPVAPAPATGPPSMPSMTMQLAQIMAAAQAQARASQQTPSAAAAAAAAAPPAPDLVCSLCSRLFTDPMVVPCCFASFCDDCIRQSLLLEGATPRCPRCHSDAISIDSLRPNAVLGRRVQKERDRMAGGGSAAPATLAATPAATATPASAPQASSSTAPARPAALASAAASAAPPPTRKLGSYDGEDDYSVPQRR